MLDVLLVVEEIARVCGVTGADRRRGQPRRGRRAHRRTAPRRRSAATSRGCSRATSPRSRISSPRPGSAATDMTTRADEAPDGLRADRPEALDHRRRDVAALSRLLPLRRPRRRRTASAAIFVERDTPGFRIGRRDFMMGLRGIPEGRLHFDGCARPARERARRARATASSELMSAYNGQRLGAATVALGIAQGALRAARWPTRRSAGSSAGPSASSRASAGSWRTWRSSSTRRAC